MSILININSYNKMKMPVSRDHVTEVDHRNLKNQRKGDPNGFLYNLLWAHTTTPVATTYDRDTNPTCIVLLGLCHVEFKAAINPVEWGKRRDVCLWRSVTTPHLNFLRFLSVDFSEYYNNK